MTALQAKTSAEVEALLAQNSHSSKQVEVLQAELHRIKGGTTLSFAALQNEELQEVRRQLVTHSTAGCNGAGCAPPYRTATLLALQHAAGL